MHPLPFRLMGIAATGLAMSVSAAAQALPSYVTLATGKIDADGQFHGRAQVMAPSSAPNITSGLPFWAEEHRTVAPADADSSDVLEAPARTIYRDADGRTRIERSVIETPGASDSPQIVEILDPFAGTYYLLDPDNETAYRVSLPPRPRPLAAEETLEIQAPEAGRGKSRYEPFEPLPVEGGFSVQLSLLPPGERPGLSSSKDAAPSVGTLDLGYDLINGIESHGERVTMPALGPSEPASQPSMQSTDTWIANQLRIRVFEMITSADGTVTTTQIGRLEAGQPDASLFAPPENYKVVDQPNFFAITFGE